ncbi:MAG: FGGY-family carbohydrate kinase [Kiritimatiellae bacterium]|nr:FGGY-family carbohydrate kinase [Kiritimatiellia bacterium]
MCFLDFEKDFDEIAASAPEGCRGLRFIADGPSGTGHWAGVNDSKVTTADKARAVIETLVERMGLMIEKLSSVESGCKVIICGGGSQSEIWRSCLARRLGCPLMRAENVSPSRGAAWMAREVLA